MEHGNPNDILTVIPTKVGHPRAQRERLLGASMAYRALNPDCQDFQLLSGYTPAHGAMPQGSTESPPRGYSRRNGTHQAPMTKGSAMSDKSPRQAMSKKSGKSLKEKRVDKNVKANRSITTSDAPLTNAKRRGN